MLCPRDFISLEGSESEAVYDSETPGVPKYGCRGSLDGRAMAVLGAERAVRVVV
jgi:hypothetical protein